MTVSFQRKSDFVERRRQGRAGIGITVALRERGRSALDARLIDFSSLGCRVDGLIVGAVDAQVWIKLPGLESLAAQRIWSSGNLAGLCFETPIHPAVAARFLPAPGSHAAATAETALGQADPLLSRREQIMAGIVGTDQSPLQRRKKPSGLGMFGRINRMVSRSVDHRAERRYADAIPEGTALAIGGERVRVMNVSPSGIKVRGLPEAAEIGESVELAFEGFPEMTGQLVWMNGSEGGIALPEASIELFDRSAG
ncbi:MAG: hypothetical protein ACKOOL_05980 [Novosphingobium sp.]